jgi:hypothetical protein
VTPADVEAAAQALRAALVDLVEVASNALRAVGRQLGDGDAQCIDAELVGCAVRDAAATALRAESELRRAQLLLVGDRRIPLEAATDLVEMSAFRVLRRVHAGEGVEVLGNLSALCGNAARLAEELALAAKADREGGES